MKKYLTVIFLMVSFIGCRAQIILGNLSQYDAPTQTYFSDIDQEMNNFIGTWKFTSNQKVFIIIIQKETMVPIQNHFEDLLVGEYSYTENGVNLINTLERLDNPTIIGRDHYISGRAILPNNLFFNCTDCTANEKRFTLSFYDPTRPYLRSLKIILRYLPSPSSATPQLHAYVTSPDVAYTPAEDSPTETLVPFGEYILTKQP